MNSKKKIFKQPNVYLIGAQKAGTTSLYSWLAQHPNVFAPEAAKDIHFFSNPVLKNKMGEFEKLYTSNLDCKISLHAGVNYLFFPETAQKLKAYSPNAKLIIILRNPVDRIVSAYKYFKGLGRETRTFKAAIEAELKGNYTQHNDQADFTYIAHSLYFKQVERYLKVFEKSQIHIMFFEELMANKELQMQQLFRFLNIETSFKPNFTHNNKSVKPKFDKINQTLVADSSIKQRLKKIIPYHKIIPLQMRVWLVKTVQQLNADTYKNEQFILPETVKNVLKKDFLQLEKLLDTNFSKLWKF